MEIKSQFVGNLQGLALQGHKSNFSFTPSRYILSEKISRIIFLNWPQNMSLYFITGNKGKLAEVQSILGNVEALDINLPEIQSLDAHEIIKAKLEEAQKHHDGEFIVEDTSLYFEGLKGLPGPFIKYFLKAVGNEGLYKMAEAFGNFNAEAKTIVGYSNAHGEISFYEGSLKGVIVSPRGEGFGWDPIFQPEGYSKTFGELTSEEKNSISMRKIALEKLKEKLEI